jgi:hypothetical protein
LSFSTVWEASVFVQTFRGRVFDPVAVRPVIDRWMTELGPTATGWLGSTSGITDDHQVFVLVRFESEEAARANSDKPEQGQWWAEMAKLFDGEPAFHDSTDVLEESVGDRDSAGFVQVILGKTSDIKRSRELMNADLPGRADGRPDILGSISIGYDNGEYAYVVYFTSEGEAREGEKKELPPEVKAVMDELMSLGVGQPEFLDLRTLWIDSPK